MIPTPFLGSPLPGESGSPTYVKHILVVGLGLVPLFPSTITLLNRKRELYNYQKRHEGNKLLKENVITVLSVHHIYLLYNIYTSTL